MLISDIHSLLSCTSYTMWTLMTSSRRFFQIRNKLIKIMINLPIVLIVYLPVCCKGSDMARGRTQTNSTACKGPLKQATRAT